MKHPIITVVLSAALACAALSAVGAKKGSNAGLNFDAAPSPYPAALPWARPLNGGAIDVLFLAPRGGLRDVIELARRIDLSPTVIAVDAAPGEADPGEIKEALKKNPALIVLANFDLSLLPEEILESIVEAARRGTGLLVIPFGRELPQALAAYRDTLTPLDSGDEVTRGLGRELVPEWRDGIDFVHLLDGEGGRFAELDYPGAPPLTHALIPAPRDEASAGKAFLEARLSLVARALRWAARREPGLRIEAVEDAGPKGPELDEIPPELPWQFVQQMRDAVMRQPMQPYALYFDRPTDHAYQVRVRIRYPHRLIERILSIETLIPKGVTRHVVQVPIGLGGFFLDFRLEDKKGVVDWFTKAVHIEGWPAVIDFQCSKSVLEVNDSLHVSLEIRRHFHSPRPSTVYIRVTGASGVVAERYVPVPAEGGRVGATLDFVGLNSCCLKVEAFAVDATHRPFGPWDMEHAAYRYAHVLVRLPTSRSFSFAAHGVSSLEPNARGFNRSLRALGVDTLHLLPGHQPGTGPALDNLRTIAHVPFDGEDGDALRDSIYALSPLASPLYSVSGITAEPNSAVSPGTSLESRAADDRRELQRYVNAQSIIRGLDRHARVGFCADPGGDYDWWGLASRLDLLGLQPDPLVVEKVRSFRHANGLTSLRFNGGPDPMDVPHARWFPWYAALHDLTGLWLDNAYATVDSPLPNAALAADGRATPWLMETASAVGELKSGFADLLQRAKRNHSGIALYGSRTSAHRNALSKQRELDSALAEAAFVELIESQGYQFDFVSTEAALAGELDPYGVLILPLVTCLSDEEIGMLRAFNVRGGAILADMPPGQFDEDGTPRPRPPLAGIFGAKHEGSGTTLLLNRPAHEAAQTDEFSGEFRTWLEEAGATPAHAGLLTEFPDFAGEIVRYTYAEADILALLRDPETGRKARALRVRLDDTRFPYDMRQRIPLRRSKKANLPVPPGDAALIAFLPYEVSRLVLETPVAVTAGRRLPVHITVKTRGALPGNHLVHITLGPLGAPPVRHYSKTIECISGQGDTYLTLPHNAPPGAHTLTAHDLLTGVTATTPITITSKPRR